MQRHTGRSPDATSKHAQNPRAEAEATQADALTRDPEIDQIVYASIPGSDPSRIILVGGHLDSRSTDVLSPTQNAPGANDSGSQASRRR